VPGCSAQVRVGRRLLVLALAAWLCSCQRPIPQGAAAPGAASAPGPTLQIDRLSVLRDAGADGFARAQEPRRFEFPQDHGPHPAFRHEWWYLTGQLRAVDGEQFGFELTFFRLGLLPPAAPAQAPAASSAPGSNWRARQLYAAHFAITDVNRGRFFSATRFARDALGLAGAQAQPFAVHVNDWSLIEVPDGPPDAGASALHWQLQAADQDYRLQLDLRADQPPVLNGDAGLSVKAAAPGAASYYYSVPRLRAVGRIGRKGGALAVSGLAWLDREWGSGSLGAQQQGWDWFALDLDDGSALMFYALRDRDGHRDVHSAGTYVDPQGHALALANADVDIEVQDHWTSPRGGRYPAQWLLRVKSLDLQLRLTPLLADQELLTQPRYWEGAVRAVGRRGALSVGAQGYVELVGYAQAQASASVASATVPPTH
jgi:predicted secreted hydrolase